VAGAVDSPEAFLPPERSRDLPGSRLLFLGLKKVTLFCEIWGVFFGIGIFIPTTSNIRHICDSGTFPKNSQTLIYQRLQRAVFTC